MKQTKVPVGGIVSLILAALSTYYGLWDMLGWWGSTAYGIGLVILYFSNYNKIDTEAEDDGE